MLPGKSAIWLGCMGVLLMTCLTSPRNAGAEKSGTLPYTVDVERLPALPGIHGVAGAFAGVSDGALVVAGGANFPDRKPWDGGKKSWHDDVHVLEEGSKSWSLGSRLDRAMGYGVSVTIPEGVLCIGGEDGSKAFSSVFLLKWDGEKITTASFPKLPLPLAFAAGALLDNKVYVIGGASQSPATTATATFLKLDLANLSDGWQRLEPWPGRPRLLAVAGVLGDSLYLCSGVDLAPGPNGTPIRTYLKDAWRFKPGEGWKQIAELPRPAVAAPSPAPALSSSYFALVGGDDGSRAALKPSPDHPGFTNTILIYHADSNTWTEQEGLALPSVTTPLVHWNGGFTIPSGEIRPGVRTPEVRTLRFKLTGPTRSNSSTISKSEIIN